jgi:hypothetical protein
MRDCKGRTFHIGDKVTTNAFGVCMVRDILDEGDHASDGANVLVRNAKGEEFAVRVNTAGVNRIHTMNELAQIALDVQNASNISGVIHSFSEVISELRTLMQAEPGFSNDALRAHPVCVLFSSKISSLTFSEEPEKFTSSYDWAKRQVEPKPKE